MHDACCFEGLLDQPKLLFHVVQSLVDLPGRERGLVGVFVRLIFDRLDHIDQILKWVATRLRCRLIIRRQILIRCKLILIIIDILFILVWCGLIFIWCKILILIWCLLILIRCGIFIGCRLFVRSRSWVFLRIDSLAVGLILEIELDTHALFVVITDHSIIFSRPCHNLAEVSAPVPREVDLNVA